jgi:hypothetical protein
LALDGDWFHGGLLDECGVFFEKGADEGAEDGGF